MVIAAAAALLLLGFLLVAIEIYTPGGIVGAVGAVLLIGGNLLIYNTYGTDGLWPTLSATVLGTIVACVLGFVVLPKSPLGRVMTLRTRQTGEAGYVTSSPALAELVGKEGVASSMLRPAGVVTIEGKRVDALAPDAYIESGTAVRVVSVKAGRVLVKAVDA